LGIKNHSLCLQGLLKAEKSFVEFQSRSGERAKAETREGENPGAEKEGKYSSGLCFGYFAHTATLLSPKS